MTTPDELFARYATTGDVEALAEVFDAVGPRLLRLASHFAPDEGLAGAEDLLQATFVVAIEKARRYDPARPLEPWLAGILANEARKLAAARRHKEPAPARDVVDPHPIEQAQKNELLLFVRDALSRIAALYSEPLRLHLVDGLGPAEIAARLDRSPGAVRVQLHRGLEMLKRELPGGLAVGSLALLLPARGLAAVKSAVLAHADALPGLALGGILMKKTATTVLAVCLAVGALFSLLLLPQREPHGAPPAESPVAAHAADKDESLTHRAAAPAERRPAGEPASAPAQAALAGFGELLVRVTDKQSGALVPGVGLDLVERCANRAEPLRQGLHTGADGSLRLERVRAGLVEVRADGEDWPHTDLVRADRTTCITIPIDGARLADCDGTTVDAQGKTVAGAEVYLITGHPSTSRVVAISDEAGRFRLPRRRLAVGAAFGARTAGGFCSNVHEVLPDSDGRVAVRLTLLPCGADLFGMVVDASDHGIANARVRLEQKPTGEPLQMTAATGAGAAREFVRGPEFTVVVTTDTAGRFVAHGVPAGNIRLHAWCPGHAPATDDVALAPGERKDLKLTLGVAAALAGRVTDASGTPIANATVEIESLDERPRPIATQQCDANGEFAWESLVARECTVRASAQQLGYAATETRIRLEGGATQRWDAVLKTDADTEGVVVDAHGTPVYECLVYGTEAGKETRTEGAVSDVAVSDVHGRFRLRLKHGCRYALFVHRFELRYLARCRELGEVEAGTRDLRIVLPELGLPSAALEGSVVDEEGNAAQVRLELLRDGAPLDQVDCDRRTGQFRTGALQPGQHSLRARAEAKDPYGSGKAVASFGPYPLAANQKRDLGKLTVLVPKDVRARGQLVVTLTRADGKPVADVRAACLVAGGHDYEQLDVAGVLGSGVAAPVGLYTLIVYGPGFVEARKESVAIVAAETTRVTLQVEPAASRTIRIPNTELPFEKGKSSGRFVIRGNDGRSVCERPLDLAFPTSEWWLPFPRGENVLTLEVDGGRRWQARFTITSLEPDEKPITYKLEELR